MKKLGLLVATGVLFVGMSSCVKDYDCTCVTTDPDGETTSETLTVKGTKKTSETLCKELDNESGSGDFVYSTKCNL